MQHSAVQWLRRVYDTQTKFKRSSKESSLLWRFRHWKSMSLSSPVGSPLSPFAPGCDIVFESYLHKTPPLDRLFVVRSKAIIMVLVKSYMKYSCSSVVVCSLITIIDYMTFCSLQMEIMIAITVITIAAGYCCCKLLHLTWLKRSQLCSILGGV